MRVLIAVFIFLSTVWATTAHSEELTEQQIRELVLDTIRANPEIIQEAITLLQQRQEERKAERIASILTENRELFERDPTAPVLGNPEGDVTLVEFFDYNCPYCKQVAGDVKSLIEKDGNIRLVYREWPILGEGSVFAARAALAARKQGKYEAMHWALMSLKRADERSVLQVASDLGLDIEKLQNDMQSSEIDEHIGISHELTQALGITGTPSFTIGDKVIFGAVPLTELGECGRGKALETLNSLIQLPYRPSSNFLNATSAFTVVCYEGPKNDAAGIDQNHRRDVALGNLFPIDHHRTGIVSTYDVCGTSSSVGGSHAHIACGDVGKTLPEVTSVTGWRS